MREYLTFVAELKKIPKAEREEQIDKVIHMVQLGDVEERLIRNLSKGYKQRVGLAQAILGFPEIIILDEPTVGLDPKQIIEIRQLIRELAKEHTVILSSHILAEIQEVCDYIMIISKGHLVASDTPENLEKALSNQRQTELVAKGEMEKVQQILEGLEGLQKVEVTEGKEEGTTRVTFTSNPGTDSKEELFYAFAEAKCPLLQIVDSQTSLEDVFLELTKGNENQEEEEEHDSDL